MSALPRVSGRDVVKAFLKAGYEQDRQRGSHVILRQQAYPHRRIVVPDHMHQQINTSKRATQVRQSVERSREDARPDFEVPASV